VQLRRRSLERGPTLSCHRASQACARSLESMLGQRGARAENAMTQEEGDRRIIALYGFGLIFLGVLVAFLYVSRDDDSWAPIILTGASLAIGVCMLAFAFRRYGSD
jgi:hypothetical protein